MTNWAFFGGFGVCLVLSGLADGDLPVAGSGFAGFVAGFIAHIIINRIFGTGFTQPQIALGLAAFTVGVLCFIASAIFDPAFGEADSRSGSSVSARSTAASSATSSINYGVRGSYEMVLPPAQRGAPRVVTDRLVWLFVFFALYACLLRVLGRGGRARGAHRPGVLPRRPDDPGLGFRRVRDGGLVHRLGRDRPAGAAGARRFSGRPARARRHRHPARRRAVPEAAMDAEPPLRLRDAGRNVHRLFRRADDAARGAADRAAVRAAVPRHAAGGRPAI